MSTDIEPIGALATAALVAAELQGDAGKAPAAHARHDAKCANCGVTGWGATWRTFALMFAGFFVFLAYVVMILAISLR